VQERFEGPEALYVQLAEHMARRIEGGEFATRDRLPGEFELVDRYGLSRVTVRQAMALLEKRGLVVRRRGVGTFVAPHKVRQDLSKPLVGFYDALVAHGLNPEMSLLDYRRVTPDAHVANKLRQRSAMLVMRLYRVEGQPLAVTYVHLHPATERLSRDDVAANVTYKILENLLGYKIDRADLTIRADSAGQGPGRLLELGAAEPVLILDRTSYSDKDEPLENTVCYLRSDAYEFGLTLRGAVSLADGIRPTESVK
jgi:GntR family transcriptional regulator